MFLNKLKKINNNINEPFFVYENLFDKDECEEIIKKINNDYEYIEPRVFDGDKLIKVEEVRKANLVYLENKFQYEKEIKSKIKELFKFINNEYYKFDLDLNIKECLQFLEYNEGCHYDWHHDFGKGDISRRKLTCVVQLTDPSEYEGGELEFFNIPFQEATKKQGSAIIFPAFVYHKVNKIKSGQRHSIASWIQGTPFK